MLLAERVILSPKPGEPTVNVSRRIARVEAVEIILGEGLLGTLPHQICKPGDADIAERVGMDGINLGLVLDLVGLFGDTGAEVDIIEVFVGGLEFGL